MRHRKKGKKLGRKVAPRRALLLSLTRSLILQGKIKTTLAKAKFVQPFVEKLISLSFSKSPASKRRISQLLNDKVAEKKLLKELSEKYKGRPGGYTRIVKMGRRSGDNALISQIEFV